MKDIIKHLDNAYLWISRISVNGENVDYLAMARQEMRTAFQKLQEIDKKSQDEKVSADG